MTSWVKDCLSALVTVPCRILQLPPFQLDASDPSPENPVTSPSAFDPSALHIDIGCAMTIQFPPLTRGEIPWAGLPQAVRAVAPIQIAAHIPRVSVGVTKIRKKLVVESTPNIHPAHCHTHHGHRIDTGQTTG